MVELSLQSLGLSLTNGDGAVQSVVELSLQSLGLLLDQRAVQLGSLSVVLDDAGDTGELLLSLLSVSDNSVGQHDDLGVKSSLCVSQSIGGSHASSSNLLVESVGSSLLSLGLGAESLLELLGSLGQVLRHLDAGIVVDLASLRQFSLEVILEGSSLSSSSSLVVVHELAENTASSLVLGEALVGELLDVDEALLDLGVHRCLLLLEGLHLSSDLHHVVLELGLGSA